MKFLRVKNFERFQHYKHRNPAWIKLYFELLNDYEFARLDDASKFHLIAIWLLATRMNNRIPCDPAWISGKIGAMGTIDTKSLVNSGFLEHYDDASTPLATDHQNALAEAEITEITEAEKEPPIVPQGEREGSPAGVEDPQSDPGYTAGFTEFWSQWPKHFRKAGKSKCGRLWKREGLESKTGLVLAALRRSKVSPDWTKQGGTYIPFPMTWLNRTPWETDPAEMAGGQSPDGDDRFSPGFDRVEVTEEHIRIAYGEGGNA